MWVPGVITRVLFGFQDIGNELGRDDPIFVRGDGVLVLLQQHVVCQLTGRLVSGQKERVRHEKVQRGRRTLRRSVKRDRWPPGGRSRRLGP